MKITACTEHSDRSQSMAANESANAPSSWSKHPVIAAINWMFGTQSDSPPSESYENNSHPLSPSTRYMKDSFGSTIIKFNLGEDYSDDSFNTETRGSSKETLELEPPSVSPASGHWGFYVAITPDNELYIKKTPVSSKQSVLMMKSGRK